MYRMAKRRNQIKTLRVRKVLVKQLERLAPPYLRGARKDEMRVEYALERYIEAESANNGKLAKAG